MSNKSSGEAMVDASRNIIIDNQPRPPKDSKAGDADTHHHRQGCQLKVKMGLFQTGTFQKPRGYDPASSGGDYQVSIGEAENKFRKSVCMRQWDFKKPAIRKPIIRITSFL